jgi:hypothetical protein
MFELNPEQIKIIEALLSPVGLVLVVEAGKWLARRLGAELTVAHMRVGLGLLSAGLAYAWLAPELPALPACAEFESCVVEITGFAAALGALGTAWFGAAHVIYERLAKGLFEQLGIGA